jgi:hypothetical protein
MSDVLTMPSSEIKRRLKAQRVYLWGGTVGCRQYGSPQDLAMDRLERENWQRTLRGLIRFGEAFRVSMVSMEEAGRRLNRAFAALVPEPDGDRG